MSEPKTVGKAHWRGLDGLRGIAVIAVVIFHADVRLGVNGYIGVDVFFTLSGFLITMLLLHERRTTGRIALGRFAIRRLLRLYPALVVVCLGVLALSALAHRLKDVVGAVTASLLYVSNWWLYTGHDMFLLDHLWTLAIEEHFYLLWPTLLALALARSRRLQAVAGVMALVVIGLLLVSWPLEIANVKESYVRGAPLLVGCALAVGLSNPRWRRALGRYAPALGAVGSLVIVVLSIVPWLIPGAYLQGPTSIPGWAAAAVIIAVVVTPGSSGVRWLELPALRWCGRRAYGIYLIHFPVLSLMAHQVNTPSSPLVRVAIGTVVTLMLAEVSYRVVELPFLRLKSRFEPKLAATVHEA